MLHQLHCLSKILFEFIFDAFEMFWHDDLDRCCETECLRDCCLNISDGAEPAQNVDMIIIVSISGNNEEHDKRFEYMI